MTVTAKRGGTGFYLSRRKELGHQLCLLLLPWSPPDVKDDTRFITRPAAAKSAGFNFIRCFFLLPNVSQIIFIEPLGRLCLTEWIADCLSLASVLALWKCSGWPYSNAAHPT